MRICGAASLQAVVPCTERKVVVSPMSAALLNSFSD